MVAHIVKTAPDYWSFPSGLLPSAKENFINYDINVSVKGSQRDSCVCRPTEIALEYI